MRVLGVDLGSRRVGVAVSDPGGVVATPHTVLTRSGDAARDHAAIGGLVRELGAELVVVGLPLSMSGRESHASRAARQEAQALAGAVGVPVELCDERLTTVEAERSLHRGGVRAPARRQVVDKVAATVMLQSWLDRHR
jgi:putative Holliday junction resolvase